MASEDWRTMDRKTRTVAYDNRGAVADNGTQLARWQRLSAEIRADAAAELNLRYGSLPRNLLDIFPAPRPDAPILVHVHGGYWQRNSKDDFACLARVPLSHGLAFATIGYTLAPDASLTAIAAEVHAALDFLRARDATKGIRRKTILSGWSAGGHLAALVSSRPDIDATVAVSGIFDLEPVRGIEQDDVIRLTADEVERLSPMRHVAALHAPLVIAYGTDELAEFRRQSRDYQRACAAAGLDATLVSVAGKNHFSVIDAMLDPASELTRTVIDLAQRLDAST